jgi:hypothetical protein
MAGSLGEATGHCDHGPILREMRSSDSSKWPADKVFGALSPVALIVLDLVFAGLAILASWRRSRRLVGARRQPPPGVLLVAVSALLVLCCAAAMRLNRCGSRFTVERSTSSTPGATVVVPAEAVRRIGSSPSGFWDAVELVDGQRMTIWGLGG